MRVSEKDLQKQFEFWGVYENSELIANRKKEQFKKMGLDEEELFFNFSDTYDKIALQNQYLSKARVYDKTFFKFEASNELMRLKAGKTKPSKERLDEIFKELFAGKIITSVKSTEDFIVSGFHKKNYVSLNKNGEYFEHFFNSYTLSEQKELLEGEKLNIFFKFCLIYPQAIGFFDEDLSLELELIEPVRENYAGELEHKAFREAEAKSNFVKALEKRADDEAFYQILLKNPIVQKNPALRKSFLQGLEQNKEARKQDFNEQLQEGLNKHLEAVQQKSF